MMPWEKWKVNMKALETTLYVLCLGFLGVFVRWLQDMLGFDDNGLPEGVFWTILVLATAVGSFFVFRNLVNQLKKQRYYPCETFAETFASPTKMFQFVRWLFGGIMILGSVLLFAVSETDPDAGFLEFLSVLGVLSGISFPLFIQAANRENFPVRRLCWLSCAPIVLYSFWLVTLYKMNVYNSAVVGYGFQVIAVCVILVASSYLAGYAFGRIDYRKTLISVMMAGFMSLTCLADEGFIGMQLMLLASAGMFLDLTWIMIRNLNRRSAMNAPVAAQPDDGFVHLSHSIPKPDAPDES